MIDQHKVSLFKELFSQAETVLIIYAPDALRDHLFAATALYKTFQLLGNKEVTLLSSENLASAESDIVYLEETKTEIGNKNLCITLDYSPETVEKITSAVDEDSKKLHLTIKPKKGVHPISKENISFSYTGADADMVILVGVDDLESLDQLYVGYENLYQSTALVSINSYETSFGNLRLDILGSSCVSEFVAALLRDLQYQLDQEVATNLLAGIDEETDKLESYLATADTFDVVSYLLRAGARRFARVAHTDEPAGGENEFAENGVEHEVYTQPVPPVTTTEFVTPQASDVAVMNTNSDTNTNDDSVYIVEDNITPIKPSELRQKLDARAAKLAQTINPDLKRGRGRPKGSKNKATIAAQIAKEKRAAQQSGSNTQQKVISDKNTPKPGDLNYNPSGFGPSST